MTVSIDLFKKAMSRFASGVTVVTTRSGAELAGLTASSFSSVSVDPLLILVCIGKRAWPHTLIRSSRVFGVNVLNTEQLYLAERFAGMGASQMDRFADLSYRTASTGSPILPGSSIFLDCQLWAEYEGGDHTIFVGEVIDGEVRDEGAPLIYHQRRWASTMQLERPTLPPPPSEPHVNDSEHR